MPGNPDQLVQPLHELQAVLASEAGEGDAASLPSLGNLQKADSIREVQSLGKPANIASHLRLLLNQGGAKGKGTGSPLALWDQKPNTFPNLCTLSTLVPSPLLSLVT
jgi:hypothetical protein